MSPRIDRRDLLAALGLLALAVALLQPSWAQSGGKTAVIFTPTGEDRQVHQALMGEVKSARKSIDVAIFNFTSRRLSNALINAAKKTRVRVLMDERSAKKITISQHRELAKGGVAVKLVHLPGSGIRAPKFHHKFVVFDGRTVATGSFNWTVGADEVNFENILFVRDKSLARKFTTEFERIWKDDKLAVPLK